MRKQILKQRNKLTLSKTYIIASVIVATLLCGKIQPAIGQDNSIQALRLEINSLQHDFSPCFLDSVSLVFVSYRLNMKSEKIVEYAHSAYVSEKADDTWNEAKRMKQAKL